MRFTEEAKLEPCLRNNTTYSENRLRFTNRLSQEDETITSFRIAKRN